jgi:predicted nucleic-acid-binding protein
MSLIDTNIILRYLLNDHPQLSIKAADIIESQEVNAPIEVICEVVYVLLKVCQIPKQEISGSA